MDNKQKENKFKRNKNSSFILIAITVWVLFNAIYLIVDYLNVFSNLGINTNLINVDCTSIVISNGIVILLYVITYFSLDSRSIKNKKNQRETAELLLASTYEEALDIVNLFQKQDVAETAHNHCQHDKLNFQDLVKQQYLNLPFTHNELICKFAGDGIITAKEYEIYLNIQKLYRSHINIRVSFVDFKGSENHKRDELVELLKENMIKYKK